MLLVMQGEQTNSVFEINPLPCKKRRTPLLSQPSQAQTSLSHSNQQCHSNQRCQMLRPLKALHLRVKCLLLHEIFVPSVAKTTYRAQSDSTPRRHKLALVSIFCIDIVLFSKEMYLWSIQQTGNLELGSFDEKKVQGLTRTVTNFQDITGLSKPVRTVHTKQCEENDLNSTS